MSDMSVAKTSNVFGTLYPANTDKTPRDINNNGIAARIAKDEITAKTTEMVGKYSITPFLIFSGKTGAFFPNISSIIGPRFFSLKGSSVSDFFDSSVEFFLESSLDFSFDSSDLGFVVSSDFFSGLSVFTTGSTSTL